MDHYQNNSQYKLPENLDPEATLRPSDLRRAAMQNQRQGTSPVAPPTVPPTQATETVATEPPTTEPPTEIYNPYEYMEDLNRKYDNYFDFLPDEDGYIFADSSYRRISTSELRGMTEHQVCLARNEIYARRGYIFQSEKYNEYFANFSWYHPTTRTLPTLSEIEDDNVKTIAAYESSMGW